MNIGLGNLVFSDKRGSRSGIIRKLKQAALTAAAVSLALSAVSFPSFASDHAVETVVLGEPEHVLWETDTVVKWSSVKNAREYQVKLYISDNAERDEENWKDVDFEDEGLETAAVIRTSGTSYDFSQYLNDLHTYFAAVRAVPQVKEQAYVKAGGWVGSPDVDFREKQVIGTTGGKWRNYLEGSRYQTEDGSYLAEGWQLIEGDWYFLDASGYRLSGWQNVDGARYYLGEDGKMLKNRLVGIGADGKLRPMERYYHLLSDLPDYYRKEIDPLIAAGKLKGKSGEGENLVLDMSEGTLRAVIVGARE